jgi:tetratricopeptide (TPR) repeat protein
MVGADDIRYERVRSLSQHGPREVWAARDAWTGRAVILKTDRREMACREASILLALPPGTGPRVRDLVWQGEDRLLVVLEWLEGSTLADAAATLLPERVAAVVHAYAQCLGHLHRAGFAHADLSPRNLFLLDSPDPSRQPHQPDVRLLDFGYARGRAAGSEMPSGGTPPFVAPEIVRGWMVDERADQYSLGMIVRELFPELAREGQWAVILDRLCHPRPGRRYPHMLALRDDLELRFGVPPSPFRWPPFGGGPLRGRASLLKDVAILLETRHAARVLLSTRPGLGLSRFLAEAVLMAATGDGPPLRVIDVGDLLTDGGDGQELAGRIEDCTRSEEGLLCGLPDPSERMRWLPPGQAEDLRAILTRPGWDKLDLPPLDAAAFTELVAGSLESGGDLSEPLASRLLRESDGDLRCSAEMFRAQVRHHGSESGPTWVVVPALVRHASQRGSPSAPGSAFPILSPAEVPALRILARAGRTFPRSLAASLLAQFADASVLEDLLSSALLVPQPAERLGFVTRGLWRHALSPEVGLVPDPKADGQTVAIDAQRIDRWLNVHARPEPDQPEAILFSAQRARQLGDARRESDLLASALEWAERTRAWGHVGALLAHPDDPPQLWSRDQVLGQLGALGTLLGPPWNAGRLSMLAANALHFADPRTASELVDLAARSSDPVTRSAALVAQAERGQQEHDITAFARQLESLEQLAREGTGPAPGVVDYLRSTAARARGATDEAERHLERAADLLRGTGLPQEFRSLQLLAVLRFARDPATGIRLMSEALAAQPGPEHEAQLRANLSIMHSQAGDDAAAIRCVEEGLVRLYGHASSMRLANLRLQLAWSWAETDEIDKALREANSLLDTSAVRTSLFLRTGARMLIGFCHLHRGNAQAAVSESARAWQDLLAGRLTLGVSECLLQLVDVLLDFDAWDVAREFGSELLRAPENGRPLDPPAAARLEGLRAQIQGRMSVALDHLTDHLAEARSGADAAAAARYLHHVGLVQMDCDDGLGAGPADTAAAVRCFEEELSLLGVRGRTYFRGRALLCLAQASDAARDFVRTREALADALALAREARCKGLLRDALAFRVQSRMNNQTH